MSTTEVETIGFDPAPRGEFPLRQMLIDSDMDGIVSGAILLKVYPEIKFLFGNPAGVQEGIFDKYIDRKSAVVDLPYIPGCGLYFDHHLGNRPKKPMPGAWADMPSAARVVYEYFKPFYNLKNFARLIPEVDKFDSGAMKLSDINNPSFGLQLAFTTVQKDKQYFAYLVRMIASSSYDELMHNKEIRERTTDLENRIRNINLDLKHIKQGRDKIAILDLRNSDLVNIHISILEKELLDYEVVITMKENERKVQFTMYQNNLLELPYEYDLLAVARRINPTHSGGHKKGCGFAKPANLTVAECLDKACEIINTQIVL